MLGNLKVEGPKVEVLALLPAVGIFLDEFTRYLALTLDPLGQGATNQTEVAPSNALDRDRVDKTRPRELDVVGLVLGPHLAHRLEVPERDVGIGAGLHELLDELVVKGHRVVDVQLCVNPGIVNGTEVVKEMLTAHGMSNHELLSRAGNKNIALSINRLCLVGANRIDVLWYLINRDLCKHEREEVRAQSIEITKLDGLHLGIVACSQGDTLSFLALALDPQTFNACDFICLTKDLLRFCLANWDRKSKVIIRFIKDAGNGCLAVVSEMGVQSRCCCLRVKELYSCWASIVLGHQRLLLLVERGEHLLGDLPVTTSEAKTQASALGLDFSKTVNQLVCVDG